MTTPNQRERILKKAYEIWEAEGRPMGNDMEFWLRAELLIAQDKGKDKPAAKARTKPAAKAKAKPAAKAKAKAKPAAKAKAKAKPAAKGKATTRKTPAKPKS